MAPSAPNTPSHRDRLLTNEGLLLGQNITSADSRFTMVLQGDGNLVLYGPQSQPMWASGTNVHANVFDVVMQGDGNLVVYDSGGNPLWASATPGNPGAMFIIYPDGNAAVYATNNETLWATHTVVPATPDPPTLRNRLLSGEGLTPGDSIESQDGKWKLAMQSDGNLVLYGANNQPIWSTNTAGRINIWDLIMQSDGNLVVHDTSGSSLWSSDTSGNANATLEIEDGGLVIFNSQNQPIWSLGQVTTNGTITTSPATLTSTASMSSTNTNTMGISSTPGSSGIPVASSSSSARIGGIIGGVLGGVVLILLIICIYLLLNKRKEGRGSAAPFLSQETPSANLEPTKTVEEALLPAAETHNEEEITEHTVAEAT